MTKSLSCVPCAKRKVRCDRLEPCSHCKRRKEESVCEYPVPKGSSGKTPPGNDPLKVQQDRIEKLEQYILRSGGDLERLHQGPNGGTGGQERPSTPGGASVGGDSVASQGTKRGLDGTPRSNTNRRPRNPLLPQACLVEHDKQTTYIEAPMWYSWSEAKKPGSELHEPKLEITPVRQLQSDAPAGYIAALLDRPPSAGTKVALYRQHPSPDKVRTLWSTFLTNVHPIIKIFFDWDKEPLMHQAASDPASLSTGQQAFVFGIYFIAVLSQSDEECQALFDGAKKSSMLNDFQSSAETALLAANYASANDLLVLQALMLYMLGIRNRANPATFSSMMGIAVRTAERLGLHRDGSILGLSPMKAEERRRVWWQLQHMEILVGQLVGCLALTLFAEWDTKPPGNLEDDDIRPDMEALPPDRHGLTTMSHCLWRYFVLILHRTRRASDDGTATWITSGSVGRAEKDAMIEKYKKMIAEKFLVHCEPVNPLHVHIQIGIQAFFLAMQRTARHPVNSNTKISEMSNSDREEFLQLSTKCMDYFILSQTTPSIAHFRWHDESYFQWQAFVYIIIEAHHRATTSEAAALWKLIDRVCEVHPKLTTAVECAEISAIARLMLLAWQQRQEHLQKQQGHVDKPWCVGELEKALSIPPPSADANGQNISLGMDEFGLFDFDMIDWSFWENGAYLPPGPGENGSFLQLGLDQNAQTFL